MPVKQSAPGGVKYCKKLSETSQIAVIKGIDCLCLNGDLRKTYESASDGEDVFKFPAVYYGENPEDMESQLVIEWDLSREEAQNHFFDAVFPNSAVRNAVRWLSHRVTYLQATKMDALGQLAAAEAAGASDLIGPFKDDCEGLGRSELIKHAKLIRKEKKGATKTPVWDKYQRENNSELSRTLRHCPFLFEHAVFVVGLKQSGDIWQVVGIRRYQDAQPALDDFQEMKKGTERGRFLTSGLTGERH